MGIVACDEMLGVRTGKIDSNWKRSYRRAWRVQTDDPLTGALEVRQAIPVHFGDHYRITDPVTGAQREYDTLAFAMDIEAAIDGSCNDDLSWIVTCSYGPWDPTEFPENPLQQPIKISWTGSRFQRVCEETIPDENGDIQAIVNSAGDYFDPPIMVDDSRPTLQIVRNEQTYDPQLALLWKDTINQYTFFGFDPHCVKLTMPTGELAYNPITSFYYVITYEFEINPEGWRKRILDQGMHIWDGEDDKASPAVDKDGNDMTTPVLLDGEGGQLAVGGEPVYLEFDIYNEADFDLLGFNLRAAPGQSAF